MDPVIYNAYTRKPIDHLDKIRDCIRSIQSKNTEYRNITEDEIVLYSTDDILMPKILRYAESLLFARARLEKKSREFDNRIDTRELQWHINTLTYSQIEKLSSTKWKLRTWIYEIFPALGETGKEAYKKYSDIFSWVLDNKTLSGESQKKLARIVKNQERYHQVADTEDLRFILALYSTAPGSEVKSVFQKLGAMFTLDFARRNGLISEGQIKTFAEKTYGPLLDDLTWEEKKAYIEAFGRGDKYLLTIDDLDMTRLPILLGEAVVLKDIVHETWATLDRPPSSEVDSGKDPLSRIRRKKIQEAMERGQDKSWEYNDSDLDYDSYDAFLDDIIWRIAIEDASLLKKEGSIIEFSDSWTGTQYLRIDRVRDAYDDPIEVWPDRDHGIEVTFLGTANGVLQKEQKTYLSYTDLEILLTSIKDGKVLENSFFEQSLLTKDPTKVEDGKIYDGRGALEEQITNDNIASKLDAFDLEGSKYGFTTGTVFQAPATDEKWETIENEIWTVRKVYWDHVDLIDSQGNDTNSRNLSLSDVFRTLSTTNGFKRIDKIADDAGFREKLFDYGIQSEDEWKDGKWIRKIDDGHGHKENREITCFSNSDGEHIRLGEMQNGQVFFAEFEWGEKWKDNAAIRKWEDTPKYKWKVMSYAAFLSYLKTNKLKASERDILYPQAEHYHDHSHPHLHGSLLKRVLKWQNPASLWKGLGMVWHGIEHTLEKWAKLDAARFALKVSKFIPWGGDIDAQVYADVVDGSKEIVEKIEKKIFWLPGPRGRKKALHIAEVTDSRPEEVIAAISFLLKSYGHLYAEDIKHKQTFIQNRAHCVGAKPGAFVFFDALVMTSKMWDLHHWRAEAYDKAVKELGTNEQHEGEPTEEQLIHALTKLVDGDWEKFPYAATVVKAIGWPSSFENLFKGEWFTKMKDKWYSQTQMLNAQGRLNKAIGYFETRELKKLVGSMQAVAEKIKSPEYQAVPFIWCVWGFSSYIDSDTLQKIKGYGEQGYSFHAYAFMRNKKDNDIYTEAVRSAIDEIDDASGSIRENFEEIKARLDPDENNPKWTKRAAEEMMQFWQKHQKKLHPMLQWHNGWISKKYRENNSTVRAYADTLQGKHWEQLGSENISNEYAKDWNNEWGLAMSGIFNIDPKTWLQSMSRTLSKIRLSGYRSDKQMAEDTKRFLWSRIVSQMKEIQEDGGWFGGDQELKKAQYLAYRKEIIEHIEKEIQVTTANLDESTINAIINGPNTFWQDLRNMGIDPRAIFDRDLQRGNEDADYTRWNNKTSYGKISRGPTDLQAVMWRVREEAAKKSWKNPRRGSGSIKYTDPDSLYRWGAGANPESWNDQ